MVGDWSDERCGWVDKVIVRRGVLSWSEGEVSG